MRISVLIKSLVSSVIFLCLFSFISPAALAQGLTGQTTKIPINTNVNSNVPNNMHNWTQTVMIETLSATTCLLMGVDPLNRNQPCLGIDQENGKIGFLPTSDSGKRGGLVGQMGGMIASLYTMPVHTGDYFQNLAQNFGITKKAYAQTGGGFASLDVLMPMWSFFRNIAYTVLVVIFIVVGLGIMLRIKIDPRTVMTIQNQIPKLIIGILLITLSYAIAGFLIDAMYVTIYAAGNAITEASEQRNTLTTEIANSNNPFEAVGATIKGEDDSDNWGLFWLVGKSATSVGAIITDFVTPFLSSLLNESILGASIKPDVTTGASIPKGPQVAGWFDTVMRATGLDDIWNAVGGLWDSGGTIIGFISDPGGAIEDGVEAAINAVISWIIKIIVDALLFIVIGVIVLIALFRLWISLLMAYVKVLIYVILGPLWILLGLIPHSSITFGTWLRSLVSNLAAFPIAIIMLLFAKVFFNIFGQGTATDPFIPPLVGNHVALASLGPIIALGIILMIPNVIASFNKSMKSSGVGFGVGALVGAGVATIMNTGRGAGGMYMSSQEVIMKKDQGGGYTWGKRGKTMAAAGRALRS